MSKSNLDQVLLDVRKLSEEAKYSELAEKLKKSTQVMENQTAASLDLFINALDAKDHSLGVLHAVLAKVGLKEIGSFNLLFDQIKVFVAEFDAAQIRHSPLNFCQLFHQFTGVVSKEGSSLAGIGVLRTAIQRYRVSPSYLTSIHADLLQLCLEAKCLKAALPFLDEEIHELMTEGDQFDVKYLLLYYYYGGMIYTTLKQYDKACFFFTTCLTTPSLAISSIMIEAYKKYLMTSLLKTGKVVALPQYTPSVVNRLIHPVCTPYSDIVEAFEAHDIERLEKVLVKHEQHFARDTNLGLVQRVKESLNKRNVQRLKESFSTISLENVAFHVKLTGGASEAEKYIRDMIEKGELHASIDQVSGMVAFHDSPEKYCTDAVVARIDQQIAKCVALEEKIALLDREIALDHRYVERTMGIGHGEEDPLMEDDSLI
jgi:COP9 signalosome complex subunit 3